MPGITTSASQWRTKPDAAFVPRQQLQGFEPAPTVLQPLHNLSKNSFCADQAVRPGASGWVQASQLWVGAADVALLRQGFIQLHGVGTDQVQIQRGEVASLNAASMLAAYCASSRPRRRVRSRPAISRVSGVRRSWAMSKEPGAIQYENSSTQPMNHHDINGSLIV